MRRLCLLLVLLTALPVAAGQKWALLVGVNDYTRGPAAWDLRGCENDVAMTRELLITKFGFPEQNVRTLLSAEATAANIAEAIDTWLIRQTKPEDIVYFHFSGHGSQTTDEDGDEEDNRDELICPSDMELGQRSTVITDDQLCELLDRIPANNVTIVLDACHSGTGTRALMSTPRFVEFEPGLGAAGGTRAVVMTPTPGTQAPVAAPASASGAAVPSPEAPPAAAPAHQSAPPAAAAPAPQPDKLAGSGGMEATARQQVTISGCRPDQTSADARFEGGLYAGALTYHLVANMKRAPADITYRALLERVARDVKAKKFTQVPQIEGDMDRPLFGTAIVDAVETPFLVVRTASGGGGTLNGGAAQGVTAGSVYALYPDGETAFRGAGLGQARVVAVDETSSQVEADAGLILEPGMRAREVLHNTAIEPLKLLVEAPAGAIHDAVVAALSAVDFAAVVSEGEYLDHRLQVTQSAAGLEGVLTVDGKPFQSETAADAAGLIAAMDPHLENAYTLKYLSALENPAAPFRIEVWANRAPAGTRDLVVETLDAAPDEKLVQARLGDVIRFNFRAERDCYLTLVNVGTSGKVTVLFPNKYRPDGFIQGGRVYRTETRGEMPFKIRARGPAGRELVKVIATLEPLDLESLRLGEAGGLGTRSIDSGSAFAQQLTRDLAAVAPAGGSVPSAASPHSAASAAAAADAGDAAAGADLALLPTDAWATDYLLIETTP